MIQPSVLPVLGGKEKTKMPMIPIRCKSAKKEASRGGWTPEEDQKLAKFIEIHGQRRWRSVPEKAGLDRCGKSCRLRWMNYLRPGIKRGNISDQEKDLIIRLHKLLGNRWSLIAGRLPGRTDNEIKNYWNSHLRKKMKNENQLTSSTSQESESEKTEIAMQRGTVAERNEEGASKPAEKSNSSYDENNLFDFYSDGPLNLECMSKFLDLDETWFDHF